MKIEKHFIGVLDIFGFEVFENNSFEQLCINYANESLQQQFINQMLHAMMAQYEKEGVKVNAIPFEDNSPCLELLESKMGIFSMLDDECNFPKGTDETFLGKLMESRKGVVSCLARMCSLASMCSLVVECVLLIIDGVT